MGKNRATCLRWPLSPNANQPIDDLQPSAVETEVPMELGSCVDITFPLAVDMFLRQDHITATQIADTGHSVPPLLTRPLDAFQTDDDPILGFVHRVLTTELTPEDCHVHPSVRQVAHTSKSAAIL